MSDLISSTLCQDLLAVFDDPSYRPPPLPEVALELIAMSAREQTDILQVVAVLERDQMLAATVLRLVGSPIYAGRAPIRSLREAVFRLGVRSVRDAVFEVALSRGVFSLPDYADVLGTVARHSTVVAYITRIVCRRSGLDTDMAFLCGLLHDVGFAGLLLAVEHVEREAAPPLHLLWKDLDGIHEAASNLLASRWGLPPEVVEVVGHHHHLHTGKVAKIAAAVSLADHLSERFGTSVLGPLIDGEPMLGDALAPFQVENACSELGIDDAAVQLIVADAERTVPDIVWLGAGAASQA